MPITCIDGEVSDSELMMWEVILPPTSIALLCDEVRAVFVGSPLSRGIALLGLSRVQLDKLFPTRSRRKNALTLRNWASKIRSEEARCVLQGATWHELRAAAAHLDGGSQVQAAIAWRLGLRG